MVASDVVVFTLTVCCLFVVNLADDAASEYPKAHKRYLHLREFRQSTFGILNQYISYMDCPGRDLAECMAGDSFAMRKVADILGLVLAMSETTGFDEGKIKSRSDILRAKLDELEFQANSLKVQAADLPHRLAIAKVLHNEIQDFIKILSEPTNLNIELKNKCKAMEARAEVEMTRTINQLVEYASDVQCDEGELVVCMDNDANLEDRVGDFIGYASERAEMSNLAEGSIKNAYDFVQARIEGLEGALKLQLDGKVQYRVNAIKQVIHKELEKYIKLMRSLS